MRIHNQDFSDLLLNSFEDYDEEEFFIPVPKKKYMGPWIAS